MRSGAREAVIKVTLWNGAPDGHRREELGDEVTIERRINTTGASTWALRSADGRAVSTARADVDALLEALSIDASNPVAVMTQDVARSFLGGGGGGGGGAGAAPSAAAAASKKFEVYVRATLLSRIEAGLQAARDTVAEAGELVKAEARRVGERRAALKDLQASVERARRDRSAPVSGGRRPCRHAVGRGGGRGGPGCGGEAPSGRGWPGAPGGRGR